MKVCILVFTTLMMSFTVFAQENVSIGPIAGLSVANLRGDVVNTNWKPGLTVGGFYNYSSRSGFGFSGQALFTQLGAQINNKTNIVNLNYVQVPLFATFFFGKFGDRVRPKIFLGPNLNFLVGGNDKDGNNINGDENNRVYNPFDLGLTFGTGLNYRLQEKIWLNIDVRYGMGLIDVTTANNTSIMNQNFGLHAGLSFPLGTYNKNTGTLRTR